MMNMRKPISSRPVGYLHLQQLLEKKGIQTFPLDYECYVREKGDTEVITEQGYTTKYYKLRYWPGETFWSHLEFALKQETLNLELIAKLFQSIDPRDVSTYVSEHKAGKYRRIIWFLYEWLIQRELEISDIKKSPYEAVLQEEYVFTTQSVKLKRYALYNNLLGTPWFCPVVEKTKKLQEFIEKKLPERAQEILQSYDQKTISKAVSYLYAKETKSSYEIEHEHPSKERIARFIRLLEKAEKMGSSIDKTKLIQLQQEIVDPRYANTDFRSSQNYVGETVMPGKEKIHYICPRPEDVQKLMKGWVDCHRLMIEAKIHPVIIAATISFGFVFIHPFDDGNGRLHRFIIHQILSSLKFTPQGFILPVSSTMLNNIIEYDRCLELFSNPLNALIKYSLDQNGAMTVHGPTDLYYRFPRMTRMAEYLFGCVEKTIETDFKYELDYLVRYEDTKDTIRNVIDMPDRKIDLFIRMVSDNMGKLSKNKRNEFYELNDSEIAILETIVRSKFLSQ